MSGRLPTSDDPPTSLQEWQDSRDALLFMLEDLEAARKQIEQSHQEWVAALDAVNDLIFLHDSKHRILRANRAYQQRAGLPFNEIIGKPYYEVFPKTDGPHSLCQQATKNGCACEDVVKVEGRDYRLRIFPVHDEQGQLLYGVHSLEDITEHERMTHELVASEERNRLLFEGSRDALMTVAPPSWKFTSANQTTLTLFGVASVAEFTALGPWDVSPEFQPDGALSSEKAQAMIARTMQEGSSFFEWEHRRLDGSVFAADVLLTRMQVGAEVFLQATVRDISERKQVEQRLKLDNLRMQATLQLDKMAEADDHAILDFALERALALAESTYGFISKMSDDGSKMMVQAWSKEVMQACAVHDQPIEFKIAKAGIWAEPLRTSQPFILNDYAAAHPHKHGTPAGHVAIQRFMAVPIFDGERIVMTAAVANKPDDYVMADAERLQELVKAAWSMIQRNHAERALRRSNRALLTISGGNQALIHATDESALLQEMCRVAVKRGGYCMAWVGYARDDADKSVQPMASYGFDEGYLEMARITWADSERGNDSTGRAVRNRRTELCQDFQDDPRMAPWQAAAKKLGYAASIALPLMDGEKCFGVFTLYSTEQAAFAPEEVNLLEEMAGDLAFGILTLRVRQAHQQHEQLLQQNMLKTVKAIAGIVEMRDPYTSGHQARVAEIAQALGRQLGLAEEEVHAIFLAGLVHDLGKVRIPAEILSKPGRLDEVEFSLIKMHAQAGYDILKDIDFAWPIAQMVLQHHERMDGSGYPQGLQGDAILLGARILCVADVVEAMSSHRPYRPGLGVAAALAELERGRGTAYDPQVVDACLVLFKEKKYVLPH
jgi:PAS domain S-box-containing protein